MAGSSLPTPAAAPPRRRHPKIRPWWHPHGCLRPRWVKERVRHTADVSSVKHDAIKSRSPLNSSVPFRVFGTIYSIYPSSAPVATSPFHAPGGYASWCRDYAPTKGMTIRSNVISLYTTDRGGQAPEQTGLTYAQAFSADCQNCFGKTHRDRRTENRKHYVHGVEIVGCHEESTTGQLRTDCVVGAAAAVKHGTRHLHVLQKSSNLKLRAVETSAEDA